MKTPDSVAELQMPAAQACVEAIADVNGEREWNYGSVCLILGENILSNDKSKAKNQTGLTDNFEQEFLMHFRSNLS